MRLSSLLALLISSTLMNPIFASSMTVGDGQVDGTRLDPYKFTWLQCAVQEDIWSAMPELTESMQHEGHETLVLKQHSTRPDGGSSKVKMTFDSSTFAPLSLNARHSTVDDQVLAASQYQFSKEGYSGEKTQGDQSQSVNGKVSSEMYAGVAMGLPLATLPWQDEPLKFPASMVSFDGTYEVIATWASKETIELTDTEPFEAYLVDVEWHHNESGDVYPPGPDATGGRYWLVPNPPEGVPYVLRYKTDAYAVEFTRVFCPE